MPRHKQECEHVWLKNGHKDGKQRYICKKCKKTCGELNVNTQKYLFDLNLRLLNSYLFTDDIIWSEEGVMQNSQTNDLQEVLYSEDDLYRFKVVKIKKSLSEFMKMLKKTERLYKPMIVYMNEINPETFDYRDNQLLIYEVY